jgi:hypothetical protein
MTKKKAVPKTVNVTDSVTVTMRTLFSLHHIQSAAHLARLSAELEAGYDGASDPDLSAELKAYVVGSVFASVAFLEAGINELFIKVADERIANEIQKELDAAGGARLAAAWKAVLAKKQLLAILDKYQLALSIAGQETFDPGVLPYQDVDLLIRLRNELTHAKPEWVFLTSTVPDVEVTEQSWERRLQGKFPLSPLYESKGNPFFPDKCLSHGCAEWGVSASLAFGDAFYERVGLTVPYDHIRHRLATE